MVSSEQEQVILLGVGLTLGGLLKAAQLARRQKMPTFWPSYLWYGTILLYLGG